MGPKTLFSLLINAPVLGLTLDPRKPTVFRFLFMLAHGLLSCVFAVYGVLGSWGLGGGADNVHFATIIMTIVIIMVIIAAWSSFTFRYSHHPHMRLDPQHNNNYTVPQQKE